MGHKFSQEFLVLNGCGRVYFFIISVSHGFYKLRTFDTETRLVRSVSNIQLYRLFCYMSTLVL
jgi:hypothetical protein